jgi:hypothetical protein
MLQLCLVKTAQFEVQPCLNDRELGGNPRTSARALTSEGVGLAPTVFTVVRSTTPQGENCDKYWLTKEGNP